MGVTVEICVEGPDGAASAATGGADRVEVCAALDVGGVTPSRGLLIGCREAFAGELTVLVRPRGGDFVHSPAELDAMRRDIDDAGAAGADGVTLGLLRRDGTIDLDATAALVDRARPLIVTFHRAVDVCRDPVAAVDDLAVIGIDRVLSSGAAESAAAGADVLRAMRERAGDRVVVQAAAGVRSSNVAALVRATGVGAVHASASGRIDATMKWSGRASMGAVGDAERSRRFTDAEEVRALVAAARAV